MKTRVAACLLALPGLMLLAAERTPVPKGKIQPPDDAWKVRIAELAPDKPRVEAKPGRRVLVFSLATGYCHAVIPHVQAVLDELSQVGGFEVTHSVDISAFDRDSLRRYDAIVLNNTCTRNPGRNMFVDALSMKPGLDKAGIEKRAAAFERDLERYVASGRGLMLVHGAIVFLNNSPAFSKMVGGSFVMHPKLQEITLTPVEPEHPLLEAFRGEPFIHHDEPYLFAGAYPEKNFRPLLEMDVAKLQPDARRKLEGDRRFVSWIKPHGEGRVFYVSPSHQPESYLSARMLQFYLDGLQYVLGDLEVDDSVPAG
jgi:type 1 glutamine amidotransferase